MKRAIFLYLFLFIGSFAVSAQNQDSLLFVQKDWNTKKIKRGLVWKQANFDGLFASRQEINIIEVDLKKLRKKIKLAGVSDSRVRTSEFAVNANATAAINGGFFNVKDGGAVDFIKIDGEIINTTTNRNVRANALFAFDGRQFSIVNASDSLHYYEHSPNVVLSGPLLLSDGQVLELDSNAFNNNRHPRSAIAIKGNKLLLITVDGRNSNAQGMSLPELRDILYWYGATHSMNLDGGGSTTLYIKGETRNGIVNYPSDNKLFDHEGERSVANVILIH